MIQSVLRIAFWITGTIGYYLLVGHLCRGIRNNPLGVRVYLATRGMLTRAHRFGWYAAVVFATVVAGSGITWVGTQLAPLFTKVPPHPPRIDPLFFSACAAAASLHYSIWRLWPRGPRPHHRPLLPRLSTAAAYLFPLAYVVALHQSTLHTLVVPWWMENLGTYMLVTPILIWLCGIRIRTALCLLLGLAIHDGIHVFGTGWMDVVMHPFMKTPFVFQVPEHVAWQADFSLRIGHGDLIVPGILVVSVARLANPHQVRALLGGTALGAGCGFALASWITPLIHRTLPFLIVVVPTTLIGYGIGALLVRRQARAAAKLAPQSQPL